MAKTKLEVVADCTEHTIIPLETISKNRFTINSEEMIIEILDCDYDKIIMSGIDKQDAILLAKSILKFYEQA